jgi:hypothetical protein
MEKMAMIDTLSEADQHVLDRMLSDLAQRLAGSVDFWTIVCLAPPDTGFDRRAFVETQSHAVRDLLDQIETLLAKTRAISDEQVRGHHDNLTAACHRLLEAFVVLVEFQTLPLSCIQNATLWLAEAYSAAQASIQSLAQAVGVPVSFFANRKPDQEEHIQGILGNLFTLFKQAWTTLQSTNPQAATGPS